MLRDIYHHDCIARQADMYPALLQVRWGCEKADAEGLMVALTASDAGFGLYVKNGFEVVKQDPFDLRPYGVDSTITRKYMIRQPRFTAN